MYVSAHISLLHLSKMEKIHAVQIYGCWKYYSTMPFKHFSHTMISLCVHSPVSKGSKSSYSWIAHYLNPLNPNGWCHRVFVTLITLYGCLLPLHIALRGSIHPATYELQWDGWPASWVSLLLSSVPRSNYNRKTHVTARPAVMPLVLSVN